MTSAVIHTLARLEARKAVRAEMLAQGIKLRDISVSELAYAARLWLIAHPECFQQASEAVRSSPRLLALVEREARQRRQQARSADILTDAQRKQRCETSTIPVQISGAK